MQGRYTPNLGWIDGWADDCDRMGASLPYTAVADVAALRQIAVPSNRAMTTRSLAPAVGLQRVFGRNALR